MVDPLLNDNVGVVEVTLDGRSGAGRDRGWRLRHDKSHAGTQDARIGAGEEEGDADALLGRSIGVCAIDAFDQAMQAEAA